MAKRKPVFSPTKLAAYIECPLKYKYLYIDRIGRFYYRPNPWDSFGGTMHRVLESFHRPGGEGVSVEGLLASYRDAWVSAGYSDEQEELEFMEAGLRILRDYHAAAVPSALRTIATELTVNWDMGEFALTGRIDRLDEHEGGALEIVDYKSSLMEVTEEEVRESLAMSVYQLLVTKLNPGRRVFATVVGLAGGVKASAELSSVELEVFEDDVRRTASSIVNAEEYAPCRWDGCEACDFYKICSRQPWFGGEL